MLTSLCCGPSHCLWHDGSELSFEFPISDDKDDVEITGILSGLKFRQLVIELLQLLQVGGTAYSPAVDKLMGLLFWSGTVHARYVVPPVYGTFVLLLVCRVPVCPVPFQTKAN